MIIIILFIIYLVMCMLIAVRIDRKYGKPNNTASRFITGLGGSKYNGFGIN